jgi:anaerobic magnesium-protoporphyrin IX monomethyl ester cyclase
MDILLLNPPCMFGKDNLWGKIVANTPALGLGYLASTLEARGYEVKILDAGVERMNFEEVRQYLKKSPKVPWIGISAISFTFWSALEVAKIVKQVMPNCKLVMGGVHPTLCPEEALKSPYVDFVIRHEGDYTLPELIAGIRYDEILGLSYKDNGRIVHNLPRPMIEKLDDIPFPAYHLLPLNKSRLTVGCEKRSPATMLLGSRGCSFKCRYCSTVTMGSKVRYRSPQNIFEEIMLLMKDYGIREIHFQDDSFTLNRKNVLELCSLIIKKRIDLSWLCMANIVAVDLEMLKLMKRAGCHQICYGIESGNEEILRNLNKKVTLENVRNAVRWTKQAGIDARGAFILGCPGETEESMKKTLNFMKELNLDLISLNILAPLPGTEIYKWAKENGYLISEDWRDYSFDKSVIRLPTIHPKTVDRYLKKMYRSFYFRPSYMFNRLLKIRGLNDIKMCLKAVGALST